MGPKTFWGLDQWMTEKQKGNGKWLVTTLFDVPNADLGHIGSTVEKAD